MSKKADPKAVLEELDRLLEEQDKAEEEEARLNAMTTTDAGTQQLRKKARNKSRDIGQKIASLTDKSLEEAFNQFDTDGSETIDEKECVSSHSKVASSVSARAVPQPSK